MEDLTDDILPHEVPVRVTLSWLEKRDWDTEHSFPKFPWIHQAKYEDLLPSKLIQKSREAYLDLGGKKIYHRHGCCRITSSPELLAEMPYRLLDDGEASTLVDNAIPLICGFVRDHPHRKFSLEIYWECGYACLDPLPSTDETGSETFNKQIRTELFSKRQTNFRNQGYISRRDQSAFQQYEVVSNLVAEDASLSSLSESAKEHFVNEIIQRPALKLLLNCIYNRFDLELLRHILDVHGADDRTKQQPNMGCELSYCQLQLTEIWRTRSMFHVRNIDPDFGYHQLDDSEVMPVRYTGECVNEGSSEPELLGDGASSEVYRVRLDSAHHYLSGDPLSCFALKRFSAERKKEFDREKAMLRVLANHPKDDIVQHITSWSQSKEHFILYPEARYNLRQFMQDVDRVGFTKDEALWFLRQLRSLAFAIHHVHHLKHPTNTDRSPREDAYWGCHFDIKPENILVFEKVPGYHSRFKITDFGVGIFNAAGNQGKHSVLTSEAYGTVTYFAPDKESSGNVSRPFDMWALGCVYLELMLWLFGFFEGREGFSTARFKCTGANPKNMNDKFWRLTSTSEGDKYELLPVVEDVITQLREVWCVNMPAFLAILTAVDNLLKIDFKERWKAEDLKFHIEEVVRGAEDDLASSGDYYSSRYKANCDAEHRRRPSSNSPGTQADALTETRSASPSQSRLRVDDPNQERNGSRGESHRSQARRASESVIHTGSVTDERLPTEGQQQDSDSSQRATSRPRTERGTDPLARDLSNMAEASTASST